MKISKPLVAAMAMATSVLLAIPASASVSSWSTPADVSASGGSPAIVQIASHSGLATAVWRRSDGPNTIIQSSNSLNGAAWSTPVNLSVAGQNADLPQVVVAPNGLAIAVWQRSNGTRTIIQSSTSLNGAAWSTPVDISATDRDAIRPQVTVASNGRAIAVWQRSEGATSIVQSSTSIDGGATWSAPVALSLSAEEIGFPQLAVDPNGRAIAVWSHRNGPHAVIQSSTSLNGAAWSSPVNVSVAGLSSTIPQVTVGSNGLATAVWRRLDQATIIQASTSLNGAAWSTPVSLTANTQNADEPQVEVDSNGLITAVWQRFNGTHDVIESRTSLNGASWSATAELSTAGVDNARPQLTVNSSNLVTVVWRGEESSIDDRRVIRSSTSLNGAAWSTPVALFQPTSTNADRPQVTVDSTGLVTAVWQRGVIQSSFIRQTVAGSTPGTPGTPAATAGNAQVTVQVTAPTSGGSPVSYTVTASPGGASCTITAPATSCTITGLTNGTTYTFSSTATNGGGTSGVSASSSSVTPTAPPASAPTAAPAATLAATGVNVSWLPLAGITAFIAGSAFVALSRGRRT